MNFHQFNLKPSGEEKLRRAGVAALSLIGSQVINRAGPLSDTDFAVLLEDMPLLEHSLKKTVELENLLYDLYPNLRDIQVVILNHAPIGLKFNALKQGQPLAVLNPELLAEFREQTMRQAADLAPLLQTFHQDRIKSSFYGHPA